MSGYEGVSMVYFVSEMAQVELEKWTSVSPCYLAPVLLNRLLLPTLKANPAVGRIVHVTCAAAQSSKVTPVTLELGRAVQVDPMKPKLKPPGTKRLKLQYDEPPSNFAFKFN